LAVDKLKMGRVAVEMLLDRVAFPDAAPAVATITPRFIARGSAKIDSGQVNADSES
jgi:DNA-binding LacI/PurR family transcriptional regulator